MFIIDLKCMLFGFNVCRYEWYTPGTPDCAAAQTSLPVDWTILIVQSNMFLLSGVNCKKSKNN